MRATVSFVTVLSAALLAPPGWAAGPGLGGLFVPNLGQAPGAVRFVVSGAGGAHHVEDGAVRWMQSGLHGVVSVRQSWVDSAGVARAGPAAGVTVRRSGGALHDAVAPAFEGVVVEGAYPGIDVHLETRAGRLEQIFHVAPGADPSRIRVHVQGVLALEPRADGSLALCTADGPALLAPPQAMQGGLPVSVRYAVDGDVYGFALGAYDPARPLTIDPLLGAAFVGGTGDEGVLTLLMPQDPEHPARGRPYVVGYTTSFDLTDPEGAVKAHRDVFVARLSADLGQLEAAHVLGGADMDDVFAARLHPATGGILVAGETDSTDLVPAGMVAPQPQSAGYTDGFVALFTPDLALERVTYLGGQGLDQVSSIAVNEKADDPRFGFVYVAGNTNSDSLPNIVKGAIQTRAGILDAFVTRITPDLSDLQASSFIGGASGSESYVNVEVDPDDGAVYLEGVTNSWNDDFPVTPGAAQPEHGGRAGGSTDLFVARFDSTLGTLEGATYLGGSDLEETNYVSIVLPPGRDEVFVGGTSISADFPAQAHGTRFGREVVLLRLNRALTRIDRGVSLGGDAADLLYAFEVLPNGGDVLIAGVTGSENLPGTAGAPQTTYAGGGGDLFVARLSHDLGAVRRLTYVGASGYESGARLAVDPGTEQVVLAGYTESAGWPWMQGGAIEALSFGRDAFAVRLGADLTEVLGATYFGGRGDERISAVALHPATGDVYLAGLTDSARLPGAPEDGALGPMGGQEGFLARFDPALSGASEPRADVQVEPTSCEFPAADIGTMTSHRCLFEVKNVGQLALVVHAVTSSPARVFPVEPLPAGGCAAGTSLDPDRACTVSVRYLASALGRQIGALEIASSDPVDPVVTCAVEGRGRVPSVDAGVTTDAGEVPDAAAPGEDAGVGADVGPSDGPPDDGGGCGCRGRAGGGEGLAWIGLLALLLLGQRRLR